jgi:mRNA interferase RelE/StbE
MSWAVQLDPRAAKDLRKLDQSTVRRVVAFLKKRTSEEDDPRSQGIALKENRFKGMWRYRVGDTRVIVQLDDAKKQITVLHVADRKEVYD